MSGTPTTPEKNVHTLNISCVESLSGPYFSHSHTSVRHTTHTRTQIPRGLQPGRRPPFLSCASPLCPAEGIPGLQLEGLYQKFPLKQAPIITCGASGPSPFFPVTAPTRRRENSGGWHRLWTLRLGPSLPPVPPALRLCIPVCLCAVVSQGCGLLCDHLNHSIHHLCHVCPCKCNYMCIRATSIQHLNVSGSGGNKTCLDLSLSLEGGREPTFEMPLHQMGNLARARYQEEPRWRINEHQARGLTGICPAASPVSALC